MLAKDKLTKVAGEFVENKGNVSRKALLESCDGSAQLRPVWDELSRKYDAVIVPSTVDDAPRGLRYTGDAVSTPGILFMSPAGLNYSPGILLHVDTPPRSGA